MTPEASQRQRAAIYARFSTDLQNEKSSEDQIHLCRAFAEREGYKVTGTFQDDARSGASMHGRTSLLELLSRAKNGEFEVILVESLDRLSRDLADMSIIYKQAVSEDRVGSHFVHARQ